MYDENIPLIKLEDDRIVNMYRVSHPEVLDERLQALSPRINYRVMIGDDEKTKYLVLQREYECFSTGEKILIDFARDGLSFWLNKLDKENQERLKKAIIAYLEKLTL